MSPRFCLSCNAPFPEQKTTIGRVYFGLVSPATLAVIATLPVDLVACGRCGHVTMYAAVPERA